MKKFSFLHSMKKRSVRATIWILGGAFLSYSLFTLAASTEFIEQRVAYIMGVFEANEVKYELEGEDRIEYYKTLRSIYKGVVKSIDTKIGSDVTGAIDESLSGSLGGGSTGTTTYPSGCSVPDITLDNGQVWAGCDQIGKEYTPSLCTNGYVMPTGGQWSKLIDTYRSDYPVRIKMTYGNQGTAGYYYWSSTPSNNAQEMVLLYVNTNGAPLLNPGFKTNKLNIRCIKEGSATTANGQPNPSYTDIPATPKPYNKNDRKVCEGATFEGNMKVQNYRWYDTENKPQDLITKCSQPSRANGGLICSESAGGCCPTGKVAINGQCITPADVDGSCYATSGCKDGLTCNGNNRCTPSTGTTGGSTGGGTGTTGGGTGGGGGDVPVGGGTTGGSTPTGNTPAGYTPTIGSAPSGYANRSCQGSTTWSCPNANTKQNPYLCGVGSSDDAIYESAITSGTSLCKSSSSPLRSSDVRIDRSSNTVTWYCLDDEDEEAYACAAKIKIDATCGSQAGAPVIGKQTFSLNSTPNLCNTGGPIQTAKQNSQGMGYHDYIYENTGTGFPTDPLSWSTLNYLYTCGGINGGKNVQCKTGKIKEEGVCGGGALSCTSGIPNLKKTTEYDSRGVAIKTYEKDTYDYKAYWDGEYNWECGGYNGGATVQCAVENGDRFGYCGQADGKSLEKIVGNTNYSSLSNRTNQSIQFTSGPCNASYPPGVVCSYAEYDPSYLCTIPTGFGGDQTKIVTIVDGTGADGTFNWTCASMDKVGNPIPEIKNCSATRIIPGKCGTNNGATMTRLDNESDFYQTWGEAAKKRYCEIGYPNYTDKTGADGTYNWYCYIQGAQNVQCSANNPATASGTGAQLTNDDVSLQLPGVSATANGIYSVNRGMEVNGSYNLSSKVTSADSLNCKVWYSTNPSKSSGREVQFTTANGVSNTSTTRSADFSILFNMGSDILESDVKVTCSGNMNGKWTSLEKKYTIRLNGLTNDDLSVSLPGLSGSPSSGYSIARGQQITGSYSLSSRVTNVSALTCKAWYSTNASQSSGREATFTTTTGVSNTSTARSASFPLTFDQGSDVSASKLMVTCNGVMNGYQVALQQTYTIQITGGTTTGGGVRGACNNTVVNGCSVGSAKNQNAGSCGGNATWVCEGTNNGGDSPQCSKANAACATPIPGQCNNAVTYGCNPGSSVMNPDGGVCGGNATWYCSGINGGAPSTQCAKANAACQAVKCAGGSDTIPSPDGSNSCGFSWNATDAGRSAVATTATNGGTLNGTCGSNGQWASWNLICPNKATVSCAGGGRTFSSADGSNTCTAAYEQRNVNGVIGIGNGLTLTSEGPAASGSASCRADGNWAFSILCPNKTTKSCPGGSTPVPSARGAAYPACIVNYPTVNANTNVTMNTPGVSVSNNGTVGGRCDANGEWQDVVALCP